MNGEVGVVMHGPSGTLSVVFDSEPAGLALPIWKLPEHHGGLAMTIHKAQGSEFDRVAIVLAEPGSRLLDRALLYTAITRARSGVSIFGERGALEEAIAAPGQRLCGLRTLLWRPDLPVG